MAALFPVGCAHDLYVQARRRARLAQKQVEVHKRASCTRLGGRDPTLGRLQRLSYEYERAAQEAKRLFDAMKEAV
jgi:hypothetical protein